MWWHWCGHLLELLIIFWLLNHYKRKRHESVQSHRLFPSFPRKSTPALGDRLATWIEWDRQQQMLIHKRQAERQAKVASVIRQYDEILEKVLRMNK